MSRLTNTIADLNLQPATPEVRRLGNELWEEAAADLATMLERENAADYLLTEDEAPNKPHLVIALVRARFAGNGIEAYVALGDGTSAPARSRTRKATPSNKAVTTGEEAEEDGAKGRCDWCRKVVHNSKLRFVQPNWLDLPVHVCSACARGVEEFEAERKKTVSASTGYRSGHGSAAVSTFHAQNGPAQLITGEDFADRSHAPRLDPGSPGEAFTQCLRLDGSGPVMVTEAASHFARIRALARRSH